MFRLDQRIELADMSWKEFDEWRKQYGDDIRIAILPTGATEEYGPHAAMGADHFVAYDMANLIASRVPGTIVIPTIPFGVSDGYTSFPGTVTIGDESLKSLLIDVCNSLVYNGFKKIFVLNTHVGNVPIIKDVMWEMKEKNDTLVTGIWFWNLLDTVCPPINYSKTTDFPSGHASEIGTSVLLSLNEKYVDMNKIIREKGKNLTERVTGFSTYEAKFGKGGFFIPLDADELTDFGSLGDATQASPEEGRKILDDFTNYLCDLVGEIGKIKLKPAKSSF